MGIVLKEERAFVEFCFVLFWEQSVGSFYLSFWGANPSEHNHKVQAEVMKKGRKRESVPRCDLSLRGVFMPSFPPLPQTLAFMLRKSTEGNQVSIPSFSGRAAPESLCFGDFSPSNSQLVPVLVWLQISGRDFNCAQLVCLSVQLFSSFQQKD